jgi:ABC-type multidrug transport system fused ATPase/permease subunit
MISFMFMFLKVAADPLVHKIVVMDGGSIVAEGTYSELLHPDTGCEVFRKLLETFSSEVEEEEEEEEKQQGAQIKIQDESTTADAEPSTAVDKEEEKVGKEEGINNNNNNAGPSSVNMVANNGQLTVVEERHQGAVKTTSYLKYMSASGGLTLPVIVILLYPIAETLSCVQSYWLGLYQEHNGSEDDVEGGSDLNGKWSYTFFLSSYTFFVLLLFAVLCVRSVLLASFVLRSSNNMHFRALKAVLRSPLSFFDTVMFIICICIDT